jgi:phosphatidylinositol-4-phosphate 3-kinase
LTVLSLSFSFPDDNASSYYSEYDPFDYIYSGGTQYSDPVYDAINRSTTYDKQLISPPDGPPPPPPIGFYLPDVSVPRRSAPPLPPRNYSSQSREGIVYGRPDRKRVLTKLYEDVVVKRTYDTELVAFYEMVKQLRGNYLHNDVTTNVGYVVAAELDSQYPAGTSIKLLVHPMVECLNVGGETPQGSIEGYGSPVAFTCDSE